MHENLLNSLHVWMSTLYSNTYSPILAIVGNTKNASNLNYVIIGLVVVVVILLIITLGGNKK